MARPPAEAVVHVLSYAVLYDRTTQMNYRPGARPSGTATERSTDVGTVSTVQHKFTVRRSPSNFSSLLRDALLMRRAAPKFRTVRVDASMHHN